MSLETDVGKRNKRKSVEIKQRTENIASEIHSADDFDEAAFVELKQLGV